MSSYLSGRIVPLTPSTRPTNVEHLVKKQNETQARKNFIFIITILINDGFWFKREI